MTQKLKMRRASGNVFRDLGFPKDEARNLALRSELMVGPTQPRLNALLKGKIEQFSLDAS